MIDQGTFYVLSCGRKYVRGAGPAGIVCVVCNTLDAAQKFGDLGAAQELVAKLIPGRERTPLAVYRVTVELCAGTAIAMDEGRDVGETDEGP